MTPDRCESASTPWPWRKGLQESIRRPDHSERAGPPGGRCHPPGRHFHRNHDDLDHGAQLETETSELGQVVNSRTATTLPLNGRNFAQLAQLSAGVAPSEPGSRTETSFGFSSNGARALQNNFLLDGIDNNANLGDVLNGSAYVIQPSVDAIGEFKVETNSYSSEFGRGNGAIMNAVIKSGTNRIPRRSVRVFPKRQAGRPKRVDFLGRQIYQQNQFGATLGGPIIKDRLSFSWTTRGLRIRQAQPQLLLIPTPDQCGG